LRRLKHVIHDGKRPTPIGFTLGDGSCAAQPQPQPQPQPQSQSQSQTTSSHGDGNAEDLESATSHLADAH
jgi:hypothetical protein